MTMCFDCKHQNIMTNKGDLECHCKADGRRYNPYRPMIMFDLNCPHWERKEEEHAETV